MIDSDKLPRNAPLSVEVVSSEGCVPMAVPVDDHSSWLTMGEATGLCASFRELPGITVRETTGMKRALLEMNNNTRIRSLTAKR